MRTDIMGNKSEEPMPANQGNQFKFEAKQIDINNYLLTFEHKNTRITLFGQWNSFSVMICFLKGLVFHRDASHLWWENDLKERALGKAEVGMTEGGSVAVWARPNKKPQIASNCSERRKQRAISHASIFSHRLKYFYDLGEILSNRVPVIWEGESYQCRVICARHVREVGRGLIVGLPSHSRFLGMSDARLLGNNNGTKPGKIQPICRN